ncbi:Cyclic AMP-responsive element-binding protein 3-like protein 1 [Channa argus]|uniref:Cyclic AMP-responsive element-binding protein 3-like protein 1 n=1 Tax=Channa argus TaxID=215402 RepID=A0A6G1QU62_CHAAH|nr:Cyclic AMP-responsive element-binding protein 3-like protein 1 [Channa argus]
MESILDSLTAEKLYPSGGSNLLDLEELSDGDFLTNVVLSMNHRIRMSVLDLDEITNDSPFSGEQMDDFSSELFNSFFDDHLLERPLLTDRSSLLHMDIDSNPEFEWSFSQDLSAILVKQEEPDVGQRLDPQPLEGPPLILSPAPPHRGSSWKNMEHSQDDVKPVAIKDEPREFGQYLRLPSGTCSTKTCTNTHTCYSGITVRISKTISSSPLLTAPHKLQGSGPLMLTEEEKRTLVAEGYPVPNKLPLTKSEEKALKRVRRKIKNKISAQESRRKKKEYVECLEKKVENYTSENSDLWRKVENLETANSLLFYNEGAPLEESLVPSEGERLQSAAHSHTQTSRYIADAHSNQTTGPELDRSELQHRTLQTTSCLYVVLRYSALTDCRTFTGLYY